MAAFVQQKSVKFSEYRDASLHANQFGDFIDNRYCLLKSPTEFKGTITEVDFNNNIKIIQEFVSAPYGEQMCYVPAEKVAFINIIPNSSIILNGRNMNPGIFHICSGKSLHAIGKDSARIFILMFDRDYFFSNIASGTKIFPQRLPFEIFASPPAETVNLFHRAIGKNLFDSINFSLSEIPSNTQYDRIETAINEIMAEVSARASNFPAPSTRAYIVNKSCELFSHHIHDEDFGVTELCAHLRVSRRTLQYSFQEIIDISPSSYIRSVRLNAARKNILQYPAERIHGAAIDAGFNHLGRFSQYYKEFYGELPSETIKRRLSPTH